MKKSFKKVAYIVFADDGKPLDAMEYYALLKQYLPDFPEILKRFQSGESHALKNSDLENAIAKACKNYAKEYNISKDSIEGHLIWPPRREQHNPSKKGAMSFFDNGSDSANWGFSKQYYPAPPTL